MTLRFSTSAQTLAEALDTTNLVWTTGGNANWFSQTTNTHDGVDAVRSGIVGSNETSWIETTVVGPATVNFWTFTSPNAYFLNYRFTINGEASGYQEQTMAGDWGEQLCDLGPGTNVLRWAIFTNEPFAPLPPPPPPGYTNTGFVAMDQFTVLDPRPLEFVWQPSDLAAYPGDWAYVSAMAVGTPPLHYQWQRDGTPLFGETNDFIIYLPFTTNDAGIYSVIVSNSQGMIVSSNATLAVLPPTAPTFSYQQESLTAYSGQELWLSAGVDGSPPFYYQWRKDGTNILGASGSSSYGGYGGGLSLSISNVSLADAGNYTVIISNSVSAIESSNATLTVLQSVLPVITRHPRSLEAAAGVNTRLSSAATGTPDPYFNWTRVGDVPPPPPDPPFPPFPPTELTSISSGPNRTFYNVSPTNTGVYFVTASNYAGAVVSRDALLSVLPPITNLGSWTEGANDIFVTNGRAYLAQDTNGLAILDVSNPASPQLLGRYDTPGYAMRVQVSGGLAFVADGASVQIISITNPVSPVLVGHYNTPGSAQDIAVRSNLVFVADGNSGLLILNVTNPAAPAMVGSFVTNLAPSCVSISGDRAFLSSLNPVIIVGEPNPKVGGLLVVDISNPAQPVEVSRLSIATRSLAARESFAFTAEGTMTVLSASNAFQPVVVGSFTQYPSTNSYVGEIPLLPRYGIQAKDVFVLNDLAYVVGNYTNLTSVYVLDVRDPSDPIPVGYFTLPGEGHTLFVNGQQVYIAGYNTPLTILETPFNPPPDSPSSLSLSTPGGLKLHVQGRRGLHYTIESAAGLAGFPWQPLQTLLFTNDTAVFDVPASSGPKFFRAKRLD